VGLIWRVGLWGWACEERLVGSIDMRLNSFQKARVIPAACCLIIALLFVAAPAMAATTQVNVTKYYDNNYALVMNSTTRNIAQLQGISSVYSNGPVYMQKGTFDPNDVWGNANQGMSYYGEHNGTYVSNITDLVGGMSDGDELYVLGIDLPITRYFGFDNVYTPHERQGDMVLAWWDNETGLAGDTWNSGLCLFFYTPPSSHGVADSLNLTNRDMEASFDSWYQRFTPDKFNPSALYPVATGLMVKNVTDLAIYPPHRYDFATGGDTTEWAYEGGVGASPGLNDPSGTMADTSKIADPDDDLSELTDSEVNGEHAAQRFVFDVVEDPDNIESLAVTWIGTGTHDGGTNGATVYIWNNGTGYEELNATTSGSEVTLTGTITTDIGDYVIDGNVTVLVKQKGAQVATPPPAKYSHLETDYVKLVVTHHHSNS